MLDIYREYNVKCLTNDGELFRMRNTVNIIILESEYNFRILKDFWAKIKNREDNSIQDFKAF